jgi:hypothetical protein
LNSVKIDLLILPGRAFKNYHAVDIANTAIICGAETAHQVFNIPASVEYLAFMVSNAMPIDFATSGSAIDPDFT